MPEQISIDDQNDYESLKALGDEALTTQEPEKAVTYYKQALSFNPNFSEAQVNLGKAYAALKEYGLAEEHYLNAITADSSYGRAYNNLGAVYIDKGDSEKAIFYLNKAMDTYEDTYKVLLNLGLAYSKLNKYSEAQEAYKQAISLNPSGFYAGYQLGICHYKQNQWKQVIELYNPILSDAPSKDYLLGLYSMMAESAFHIKDYEFSIPCYLRLIELYPDFSFYYHQIGTMYKEKGCISDAIPYYEKYLQLEPEKVKAWEELIYLYSYRSDNVKVLELAKKGLENFPSSIYILSTAAYTLYELEQCHEALEYLSKALDLNSENPDLHALKGLVYEKLDRWDEAVIAFKNAYEYSNTNSSPNFYMYASVIADILEKDNESDLYKLYQNKIADFKRLP